MQMYGTEQHDFLAAMYGEMTLVFDRKEGKAVEYYYGKNKALDWNKNTSFSAVGFLRKNNSGSEIILYENAYSPRFKLDYSKVPDCIEVKRIILE